jgi:hypothetical protein
MIEGDSVSTTIATVVSIATTTVTADATATMTSAVAIAVVTPDRVQSSSRVLAYY